MLASAAGIKANVEALLNNSPVPDLDLQNSVRVCVQYTIFVRHHEDCHQGSEGQVLKRARRLKRA